MAKFDDENYERKRLEALFKLDILDTDPEMQFDKIAKQAATYCDCPIALITLIDENRQWHKSKIGIDEKEIPRNLSVCQYTIRTEEILEIEDLTKDTRFKDNSLVQENPGLRFYAGIPLITEEGYALGALCVLDYKPRKLSRDQVDKLKTLAELVSCHLDLRKFHFEKDHILQSLLNREHSHSKVLETMAEGMVLHDAKGKIVDFNPAALKILGVSKNQILGLDSMDPRWKSIHLDGRPYPGEEHPVMVTLRTGEPVRNAKMGIDDGQNDIRWININSTPFQAETGQCVVVTFQDITSEVFNNHKLESFVRGLDTYAIIAETDPKGKIVSVNDNFCKISGYEKEELLGQDHRILNSGYHSKEFFVGLWQTIKSGKVWRGEIRNQRKDGTIYWVDTTISPITNKAGKIKSFLSFRYDITVRKKAEKSLKGMVAELETSLKFTQSIQDNVPHGLISIGPNGIVNGYNKKAEEMFGYRSEEVVGKKPPSIWHDISEIFDKARELSEEYQEAVKPGMGVFIRKLKDQKIDSSEWTFIKKDGTRFPGRVTATAIKNKEGSLIGYIGVCEDITKEKEYENQKVIAEHQARLASIGEMAAGVGHEINNPLAIIKGYINTLRIKSEKGALDDQGLDTYLGKIDIAANRIGKIVKGLRTFSRSESDQIHPINPIDAIEESFNMIEEIYQHQGVQVSIDNNVENPDLQILGDRNRFQQIIVNLISNAKDAIQDQKEKLIKIRTEENSEYFVLEIEDNGKGIPDSIKKRIFDPFFTTKGINKGTGIGLALVHNFVTEMKGELDLVSEVGKGTRFKISFPKHIVEEKVQAPVEVKTHFHLKYDQLEAKAIIVDDEPEIRNLLRESLSKFGIDSALCENGEEALKLFMKYPGQYSLILSDINMPKMNGFELAKNLRAQEGVEQPKIVFTTGGVSVDFEDPKNDINSIIDGYFYKPYSDSDIYRVLKSALNSKKAPRAS